MSGNMPAGQQSGFLNSFMSFLGGEGVPEEPVKTPVLPKYIPEVKGVQMELPDQDDDFEDSASEGTLLHDLSDDQSVYKDKVRNDRKLSEGKSTNGLVMEVSDSSCDVPELPPVHVSTFQGSFLNKMNANDSQTDDNSKDCFSPGKDNCSTGKTPPVMVKESGRKTLSQSGRKMRTRRNQNKDSDEEKSQDSSTSSLEVQPKSERTSPPVRRQSTRRAKQKIEQRRVANIKKGKRLLSLYTEISDSNDSGSEVETPSAKASSDNEEDDSDKDPAWTPAEESSAKRAFTSDNDDEPYGKRRRGRPTTTPKFTPQKNLTAAAAASNHTPQAVVSPMPQTVIPKPPAVAPIATPKPSSDSVVVQKVMSLLPSPLTPLAKKGLEDLLPLYEGPPEPDSPHSFQKGDFVIERKDLKTVDTFPVWKIDSGRLLQKFEPVERNGRKLHQSMSVYSSWIDQIHYRFKAIEVLVFSAQRGKETVEVLEKYRPKPSVECVNADQIKDPFNIYVQILVSQTLEPTFLSALFNDKDKYYMDPLNTIDELISKCLLQMRKTLNWKDEFQKSVDQLPTYDVQNLSTSGPCQATGNSKCSAEKLLQFYGCVYHRDTLFVTEELEQIDAQEYEVGKEVLEVLPTYHGLQHFKMHLLKKCQVKVNDVKVDVEMEDHEVLDKCLLDHTWIKELLDSLVKLTQSATA